MSASPSSLSKLIREKLTESQSEIAAAAPEDAKQSLADYEIFFSGAQAVLNAIAEDVQSPAIEAAQKRIGGAVAAIKANIVLLDKRADLDLLLND